MVSEFNSAGEWVGRITTPPPGPWAKPSASPSPPPATSMSQTQASPSVDVFGPGVVVPDAITSKASKPTRTTAILNGRSTARAKPGTTSSSTDDTKPWARPQPPRPSPAAKKKSRATLSNCTPGTTYFFRLVAENENGTNYGLIREFETPTAVEGLSTGPVANLQPTSATLTGLALPQRL